MATGLVGIGEGLAAYGNTQSSADFLKNAFCILQHVMIPEAQDSLTVCFQYCGAGSVFFRLRMLATVQFDDEPGSIAEKVSDGVANGGLTLKLMSI